MIKAYLAFFNFIARKRILANDSDLREIHSVLLSTLSIIPLMWFHVQLDASFMASPFPLYAGVVLSTLHMLTPFLYFVTNSSFLVVNCMLTTSVGFTLVNTCYSGGIDSFLLLWLVAAPMLAGIASGRRGAKLWGMITLVIYVTLLSLSLTGVKFPDLLSEQGHKIGNYYLVFGWLSLGSVLSFIFVILREMAEKNLNDQTERVDSLFRMLFHDLSNSLGRINIGHTIARRDDIGTNTARGLEIASQAADSMFDITQNVRKMYAVSKGKADLDLSLTSLEESLNYIQKTFHEDFERKKIKLIWNSDKIKNIRVLVDPVSFKNQVLGNIISNSIKFSPENSEIEVSAKSSGQHHYTIEIKDHGIGMPSVIQENLFNLSKKTSRPGTNGEFGTGFGMHIMKSFVDIYKGKVQVISKEASDLNSESGTIFKITLRGEDYQK